MSLGVLTFSDPGGALAITDATTVSRSFSLTTFGLWARVKTLSITLTGLSHTFPDDLDFLFVGPDGTNLEFWSDAGGGTAISNQNYTDQGLRCRVVAGQRWHRHGHIPACGLRWRGNEQQLGRRAAGIVINHPAPNGAATSMRASAANGSTTRRGPFSSGTMPPRIPAPLTTWASRSPSSSSASRTISRHPHR